MGKKIINYLKSINTTISKKLFGTPIGIEHHLNGTKKIYIARIRKGGDLKIEKNEISVSLKSDGLFLLGNQYRKSLIQELSEQFSDLINRPDFSFDKKPRGMPGVSYGIICAHKTMPNLQLLINDTICSAIQAYYRTHFKVLHVHAWRNYYFDPEEVGNKEVYSNFWHFDYRSTDVMKLFVNLSDVREDNGPFHIVPRDRSRQVLMHSYIDRHHYGMPVNVLESIAKPLKTTGSKGTALLCNTQRCLHRADIPAKGKFRDIVQFQFIPTYEDLRGDLFRDVEIKAAERRVTTMQGILVRPL